MDFAFATAPGSDRPNEDHVVVAADYAIVLDGVTQLPDLDTGCVHGPAWLVRETGRPPGRRVDSRARTPRVR
ncbi:hypothetical protein GCM10011576_25990 [Micromonospora parathelypteridis]|nr:hypothetical protein GCM10011576_25990 [Micromonospora parathelypteridis]